MGRLSIAIVGSGNFGTAIARIAALNAAENDMFDPKVVMWTYQETLPDGSLLTDQINGERHENPKYLPGIKLPSNLFAEPNIVKAVQSADLLVFISPHQFIRSICSSIRGKIKPTARGVTFIKGLLIEDNRPQLCSAAISDELDIYCDAVSGANLANELALDRFCETTLGCSDPIYTKIWTCLFQRPTFQVIQVEDVSGVQVCGALKNVVAVAAGFADGAGWGLNTKSAIIGRGFKELRLFAETFFKDARIETYFESAGFADIITTCFGGRNLRMAAEFVRRKGQVSWEVLELEILKGQKMQGHLTVAEMMEVINHHKASQYFPLTTQVYNVAFNGADVSVILDAMRTHELPPSSFFLEAEAKIRDETPSTISRP